MGWFYRLQVKPKPDLPRGSFPAGPGLALGSQESAHRRRPSGIPTGSLGRCREFVALARDPTASAVEGIKFGYGSLAVLGLGSVLPCPALPGPAPPRPTPPRPAPPRPAPPRPAPPRPAPGEAEVEAFDETFSQKVKDNHTEVRCLTDLEVRACLNPKP